MDTTKKTEIDAAKSVSKKLVQKVAEANKVADIKMKIK